MSLFHIMPDKAYLSKVTPANADDLILSIKDASNEDYLYAYLITDEGISIHESQWEASMFLQGDMDLEIYNFERNKERVALLLKTFISLLDTNLNLKDQYLSLLQRKMTCFSQEM